MGFLTRWVARQVNRHHCRRASIIIDVASQSPLCDPQVRVRTLCRCGDEEIVLAETWFGPVRAGKLVTELERVMARVREGVS